MANPQEIELIPLETVLEQSNIVSDTKRRLNDIFWALFNLAGNLFKFHVGTDMNELRNNLKWDRVPNTGIDELMPVAADDMNLMFDRECNSFMRELKLLTHAMEKWQQSNPTGEAEYDKEFIEALSSVFWSVNSLQKAVEFFSQMAVEYFCPECQKQKSCKIENINGSIKNTLQLISEITTTMNPDIKPLFVCPKI